MQPSEFRPRPVSEKIPLIVACAQRTALVIGSLLLASCGTQPVPVTSPLPAVVIDAHSHVFNAHYLPVRAICLSRGLSPDVAEAIEIVVLSLTDDSHLAEPALLSERGEAVDVLALRNLKRSVETMIRARTDVLAEVFTPARVAVIRAKLSPKQRHALLEFIGRPTVAAMADPLVTAEDLARALEKAGILSDRHGAGPALAANGISGYLRFLGVVISSERVQLKSLSRTFPKVDLFVAHMMDLENTYDQQPTFPFALQVRKLMALQAENPKTLLMFGAFDPFRREAALPMAEAAYAEGVAGFKFYPPDGYRPAENFIPLLSLPDTNPAQWHHRYDNLTGADLDRWNKAFFDFCLLHDAPIFLHCTPMGFESVTGYGRIMADPQYWKSILQDPAYARLRVCFGHAGGTGLWFGGDPVSTAFGAEVVRWCETYDNVYCDAGFWETLLTDDGVTKLRGNLTDLFAAHPKLARKLVYGTDWFMVTQEEKFPEYLARMARVFDTPALAPYRDGFFSGNEARFLKLDELAQDPRLPAPTRARLASLVAQLPAGWKK